jgi:hypothetical protein
MTEQHPIAPPPELIGRWEEDWHHSKVKHIELEDHIANQAAQWGADQELEACCEWFVRDWTDIETADKLRAARRPKPPSLKEQALEALEQVEADFNTGSFGDTIRRALEALDD